MEILQAITFLSHPEAQRKKRTERSHGGVLQAIALFNEPRRT
ncbi:hypothetical protein [Nostoc sp.]